MSDHTASPDNPCGCACAEKSCADQGRRDFLFLSAGAMGAVGAAVAAWPLVDSMNPAADTLALSKIEVNIAGIEPGQSKTEVWQGKPVFIKRRTADEIKAAQETDVTTLRDPQGDDVRVKKGKEEWLVVVGVCTHLGCVPSGQKATDLHGEYNGWFCPCHGSHYDTSGRIRKGPAPKNLAVPPYEFISDTVIRIG